MAEPIADQQTSEPPTKKKKSSPELYKVGDKVVCHKPGCCVDGKSCVQYGIPIEVNLAHASRLQYTNPVCLLTTKDKEVSNVMTITWLTALDNDGHILQSMNTARSSFSLLQTNPTFVLNIPVHGMEDLVRSIGSCHGNEVDKFISQNIRKCNNGWKCNNENNMNKNTVNSVYLKDCIAHITCTVTTLDTTSTPNHCLIHATITHAYVRSKYWHNTTFAPIQPNLPPYLTFFGSSQFGYVSPANMQHSSTHHNILHVEDIQPFTKDI